MCWGQATFLSGYFTRLVQEKPLKMLCDYANACGAIVRVSTWLFACHASRERAGFLSDSRD